MDYTVQNQPNAGKLISSLRNTGYDSYSAIEDIIDNSIDAHARDIHISIETVQWNLRIMIADNWFGMNHDILDQALRLWSISDKSEISDLGKFWMWLCTASISMAKRLEIVTKEKWWEYLYSCQDLDDIVTKNAFIKILRRAIKPEIDIFDSMISWNSWTLIVMTKVDKLSDTNTSQFATTLSKSIWQIFRKFIDSGIKISINKKIVESIDPLFLNDEGTQVYSDELYELPLRMTSWKKESIQVKIIILPEYSTEKNRQLKIGVNSQWFYVLRNNREIASATTLGLWAKDPHANRVRIELSFNASLDDIFGVRFNKNWVSVNQWLMDFLKQEIGWQITSVIANLKRIKRSDPEAQIDHSDAEDVIAKKAKLLMTPEAKIEKRSSREVKGETIVLEKDNKVEYERKNFREIKTSPQWMGARFESSSMWKEGVLYECFQEGKIIIVRWNTDHPFYERIILANKDDKNIVSGIDYLIFSLASAELKSSNDDNMELLINIKAIMSSNLRSLLS